MSRYSYIPAIDGLRAVAVLAVILFHLDPHFLPGGFAGVDVFFVISGYVVARSLVSHADEGFLKFLIGFYSRRIRRILPALVFCLLVTVTLTIFFVPDSWLSSTIKQTALYAFFGLSNIALVWFQDSYFSPRAEFNPFVHTWSLSVEEQFYLILPLIIYFWFKTNTVTRRWIALLNASLMPLLAVFSLTLAAGFAQTRPDWNFYMLPSRFWELATGVILFQWQYKGWIATSLSRSAQTSIMLLGFTLIGWCFLASDVNAFPYPWALAPVLGAFLLIWVISCEGVSSRLNLLLANSLMIFLGKISYSLYLWHWPVFALMRWTVGLEGAEFKALGLVATICLALFSYAVIEKPARKAKWLAYPERKAIYLGFLVVVVSWFVSSQMFIHRHQLSLSVTANGWVWYPYAYLEGNQEPAPAGRLAGRQIFVIGNSHAKAYEAMIGLLEQRQGIKGTLMLTGQCAVGNLQYPVKGIPGCGALITGYLDEIMARSRPGDIVMFASLRTSRLTDQWNRNNPQDVMTNATSLAAIDAISAARLETIPILRQLQEKGLYVLFDAPKPVLLGPAYRCSDWFNRKNPICEGGFSVSEPFMRQLREPVLQSMAQIAQEFPNVRLWDPLPDLCHDSQCSPFDAEGLPLFFDGDHLSGHGNRVLYPSFEATILQIH